MIDKHSDKLGDVMDWDTDLLALPANIRLGLMWQNSLAYRNIELIIAIKYLQLWFQFDKMFIKNFL